MSSLAQADESEADRLFREGQESMAAKDYPAACAKFAASLRLQAGIGTRLWLADCYEKGGRLASAWHVFRDAAASAIEANDTRAEVASSRAAALEPKLARIVLHLGPRAPLEIRVDGVKLPASQWSAPIFVDKGRHELHVVATATESVDRVVDVDAEGKVYDVDLVPETKPPPAPTQQPSRLWPTVGWSLVAASAASIGVGAYLGLHAKSKYDDAADHCPSSCDDAGYDQRKSAFHFATGSTIAFVAGGAFLAAGITVLVVSPRSQPSSSGSLTLQVGLGSFSIGGAFR
ncbi:MAG: hypothetical protein ACXWP4_16995 [Polyangiales bacterium]